MGNVDKRLQELEYALEGLKKRGIKEKEWRLTKIQREYVESLGYELIPLIYRIRTKTFKDLYSIRSKLIKEIHFANKKRKKTIGRPLNEQEKEVLRQYGVKYDPIKFKIILD